MLPGSGCVNITYIPSWQICFANRLSSSDVARISVSGGGPLPGKLLRSKRQEEWIDTAVRC
jgi:hypothetical protein